jgi:hypothetical protein
MSVTMMPPTAARPEETLVAVVDALAQEVPADLPGAVSLERAKVLLAQSDRLRTLALKALSDVEVRQLYAQEGAPTTGAWVRGLDVQGVTGREVALARRLRSVPQVEAELMAGRLSSKAGSQVTTAVGKARPFLDRPDNLIDGQDGEAVLYGVLVDGICEVLAEQRGGAPADDPEQEGLRAELEDLVLADVPQLVRLEAAFVLLAQRSVPELLASTLSLLLDALLPQQHDARARKADEDASVLLQRNHGRSGWHVNGEVDDELGEMLDTIVRAERVVDPEAVADTDAWRAAEHEDLSGLDPRFWPDRYARPRTRGQQNHAALKAALRRLLDEGLLGTREKALPHVAVTTSLDFVQGVPGALPARAMSGARWSRMQVRRLLCRGEFTRMVLDAGRRVVEVSHTQRTLTAIERQILYLQWGHACARDSCIRGPATGDPLVPHHGNLFSQCGTTSVADSVPFCKQDHHYLHDDRRVLKLKDGRWIGPDGWVGPAEPEADDDAWPESG